MADAGFEAAFAKAYLWHADLVDNQFKSGLPQAVMLVGRLGDGLERLCLQLAARQLAANDEKGQTMIAAGSHPDLHFLRREINTAGNLSQQIVLKQIRQLIEATALTPVQASCRVAVIVPACRMNISSANALLKILEEPTGKLRFILGCENPGWLPATIRSRCQKFTARHPTRQEAIEWLEAKGAENAQQLLEIAGGRPLQALESGDLIEAYKGFGELCSNRKRNQKAVAVLEKLHPELWLPWALQWAADGAKLAYGLPIEAGKSPAIKINTERRPAPLAWLDLYRNLAGLARMVNSPINKRLLLEHVLWQYTRLTP